MVLRNITNDYFYFRFATLSTGIFFLPSRVVALFWRKTADPSPVFHRRKQSLAVRSGSDLHPVWQRQVHAYQDKSLGKGDQTTSGLPQSGHHDKSRPSDVQTDSPEGVQ